MIRAAVAALAVCCCILLSRCAADGSARLAAVVEEVNKSCPAMVDSETRIDNLEVRGDSTLRYNYSLVNVLAQNVDTFQFRRAMWPGIVSMIRISPDMKRLRDAGTVIEYFYADRQGKPVYTFTVTPAHYR